MEIVIGIIFVGMGIWFYYEIQNAPLMPDDWEEDPEVLDFLERMDEPGPWDEKYDKSFTVGGLSNDKDGDFMKFQKKLDKENEQAVLNAEDPNYPTADDEDDYPDFHEHDIA